MSAPLLLVAYVVAASLLGGRGLARATWTSRSPRYGIWAWQTLSWSVAAAILLAGLSLAVPLLPARGRFAELMRITPLEVDIHYGTPAGRWLAGVAVLLTAGLAVRLVVVAVLGLVRTARVRRRQAIALALVAEPREGGFVLLDDPRPLVYCLPGRRRTVVVTRGARDLLTDRELAVVLRHERAHLRARHDLALAASAALAGTFGSLPAAIGTLFRGAHEQVSVLTEMQADDAARSKDDRRALARALVALGTGSAPIAALGAGGGAAVARVRRLTSPTYEPLNPANGLGVALVGMIVLSTPVGLALAPAFEAATRDCCTASVTT